jgi:hypothetical protein
MVLRSNSSHVLLVLSTAILQALAREAPKAQAGGVGAQQNEGRPLDGASGEVLADSLSISTPRR